MTALKEWYSAAELAGLPGMPGTERRVRSRMASCPSDKCRPRAGRGGGREYHISALPRATQEHLRHQAGVRNVVLAALTLELPPPWHVRLLAMLLRPAVREILRQERAE